LQASETPDTDHIPTNSSTSHSILGSVNGFSNPGEAAYLSHIKNNDPSMFNGRQ